mmetsp:Transcript_44439/g.132655  ORF Transcript_44439/g.132655 Transcript_44439/m.132655 type:complete len:93 (+) Transcript_44439:510-788(+)
MRDACRPQPLGVEFVAPGGTVWELRLLPGPGALGRLPAAPGLPAVPGSWGEGTAVVVIGIYEREDPGLVYEAYQDLFEWLSKEEMERFEDMW